MSHHWPMNDVPSPGRMAIRALAGLALGLLGACAGIPAPQAPAAPLPDMPRYMPISSHTELRQEASGALSWIGAKWNTEPGRPATTCYDYDIDLNTWNPVTGELVRQHTGLRGGERFALISGRHNWFAFVKETTSICPDTSKAFIAVQTPTDVISLEVALGRLQRMEQFVALSDDTVMTLERDAATGFPRGLLVHREGRRLSARPVPDLPILYGDDAVLVAIDRHRAMLIGGSDGQHPSCISCRATTQIFDADTMTWSAGPRLLEGRSRPAAVRLPDGSILVAGGYTVGTLLGEGGSRNVERWNPKTNVFEAQAPMQQGEASARPFWMPGRQGRTLLFAQGVSTAISAYDLATKAWFVAGVQPDDNPSLLFPFLRDGQPWMWQMIDAVGDSPRHAFKLIQPGPESPSSGSKDVAILASNGVSTPPDLTRKFVAHSTFVAGEGAKPALLLGPLLYAQQERFLPGGVTGIDADGHAFPLPPLNHAREEPEVVRLGEGVLVLRGHNESAYRLESPPLPAEWLPSVGAGLQGRWRDVADTGLRADSFLASSSEGGLLQIAPDGVVERARIAAGNQDAPPGLSWMPWTKLKLPRRSVEQARMTVRQFADGRVVVAGGEVQSDRLPADDSRGQSSSDEPPPSEAAEAPADASQDSAPQDAWYSEDRFEVIYPDGHTALSPESRLSGGLNVILDDGRVARRHDADESGKPAIEVFVPEVNRWKDIAPPPSEMQSRYEWRLQGFGNDLLILGQVTRGRSPDDLLQVIWRYDDAAGQWLSVWREAARDPGAAPENRLRPGLVVVPCPGGQRALVPLLP